ncbi:MAG: DUF2089 family protein [Candidatus Cloacimonadaceae bacterium]|nr:DUF2089 family protein [Candidatus Cloacimonadaceae bacterium]MDP3115053.1 DUF2089 family protein [Candidatus Cloacimonadaceae bacterium]
MDILNCPLCHGALVVKEYHCRACAVSYNGEFERGWPELLRPEQLEFVKTFILVQGNIKEMEKRLKISYPTVKNRLVEIIRRIGKNNPASTGYEDILCDLEEGFIKVEDAIAMIETRRKQ